MTGTFEAFPEDNLQYSRVVRRFLAEEEGQDLIEYGLLLGMVTAGLIAIFPSIQSQLGSAFVTLDTSTNNLWVPPCPAANPCP